jgi:hypothetical protein
MVTRFGGVSSDMNNQQQLYFEQAKSDWEMFNYLEGKPECHRLHFLQMFTEKLGKASKTSPGKIHHGFVKFIRSLPTKNNIWKELGFHRRDDLAAFLSSNRGLAQSIEDLAPTKECAGDGPNPEYPWPPPPGVARFAPVHFRFEQWKTLSSTRKGQKFVEMLGEMVRIFPKWF